MTPTDARRFLDQFEKSRTEVQRMKRDTPYVFREWQRLKAAEQGLHTAQLEYSAALAAWENLATPSGSGTPARSKWPFPRRP